MYGNDQECSLETNYAGWLSSTHFDVEFSWGYLSINGWTFSGGSALDHVPWCPQLEYPSTLTDSFQH